MNQDRRTFLGQTGKLLLLTASAAVAWEHVLKGSPETAPNYKLTDHWWGMAIDIEKCIGCGNCVRACKTENDVPCSTTPSARGSSVTSWTRPTSITRGSSRPNGGYDGFHEREVKDPNLKMFFVPKLCNHCAHSPCVQVCPVGATFESPDGVVLVDKTYCLGCRYCVQACPYGCRFIDPRTETVDKCSLCYHRITKGLTTACCETCPTGARALADLKNPKDPIHAFLRDHKVQVLKPQMATGSKMYYNGLDGSVR